jgi:hypothetical protein
MSAVRRGKTGKKLSISGRLIVSALKIINLNRQYCVLLPDHFMNVTIAHKELLIVMHFTRYLHFGVLILSAVVITETIQQAVRSKP